MLPATRKPLQLRSGEQNLHIPAARFLSPGRPAAASLCSPLPANPSSSVSGSKIFTFPPSDFVLPGARWLFLFAPRAPLTLVTPCRGAKSSHFRRRISTSQALGALSLCSTRPANPCDSVPGSKIFTFPPSDFDLPGARGSRSLLPAPREPLQLRSGEQNLHIPVAGFRPLGHPAAPSLCSPLSANPCSSVPGSKIFTFPPPDFDLPGAWRRPLFAPPLPANPCSSVSGSKIFTLPPPDFDLSVARCAPSLCSPLPANPCSSVPGSKIFTLSPPALNLPGARWLYASKGATAYPRKTKVNPLRLYFFCTSLKSGHFSPQNRLFGLFPCRMKFAKKFYSAILSIRKDALGALYFYAWRFVHLRRACAPLSPSAPLLKLCTL